MNTSCPLAGGLTLHHSLPSTSTETCQRAALEFVASKVAAFVITFSVGSNQATSGQRSQGLERLSRYMGKDVVAVAYGKGSSCDLMPRSLRSWAQSGSALCITGANVGAREAHSVLHFCAYFYEHLPRAVTFMQDDPFAVELGGGSLLEWAQALKADAAARLAGGGGGGASGKRALGAAGRPHQTGAAARAGGVRAALGGGGGGGGGGGPPGGGALAAPWAPTPCGCRAVREGFFSEDKYGGYRPIAWLLRTFFDAFRNASALPPQIVWPAGAQFSAARLAVRSKPPSWRKVASTLFDDRPIRLPGLSKGSGRPHAPQSAA